MRHSAPASLIAFAAATLALLAGCGTTPTGAPRPGERPSLAAEQRRLSALFDGTPVVFAMQGDGSLRTDVPLRFSFDAGASVVKPPLAKVLDTLAASQRQAGSRLLVVAPADKRSGPRLAAERAASARDYLVGRGLAATRFTVSGAAAEPELVRIVVSDSGSPRLATP